MSENMRQNECRDCFAELHRRDATRHVNHYFRGDLDWLSILRRVASCFVWHICILHSAGCTGLMLCGEPVAATSLDGPTVTCGERKIL